ncbi:MAG: GAP family protein [Gaiellaceae bacterium]
MGQGISEVLPFAIGIAIVPIPVIAVIVMLFSSRARVNGPVFLLGWVTGLAVVFAVVFALADAGDASTDSTASDTVSWLKILLGAALLLLAGRSWRKRPAPGVEPAMPKWMAGIDSLAVGKAFGLGALLASANPKNLILVVGAATGLAQLGLATGEVVVSAVVFVAVASLTVGGPVVYYFVGGEHAKSSLEELKAWLITHYEAVMTVLFLVFGVVLISKGLAPLTG